MLRGEAAFELAGERLVLGPGEGLHVRPEQAHNIRNATGEPLEFLMISEPHAHGDREVVPA